MRSCEEQLKILEDTQNRGRDTFKYPRTRMYTCEDRGGTRNNIPSINN